ncbi:hypothetical protein [Pseudomonas vranovensis]|uniref:hypothetical protein n=1 Tax=Pseudomonas vranovensis TaxID=321661 RepID=UPI000492068D|nr:hypothetical protein [Pseudomonas vranovensis]
MPTENRSSNTEQMVSVPRELLERCDFGRNTATALAALPELRAILAKPAAQHQSEPVFMVRSHGSCCWEESNGEGLDIALSMPDEYEVRKFYLHPPTSDGFSAGDMADQGAKAFAARDPEVEQLRAKLVELRSSVHEFVRIHGLSVDGAAARNKALIELQAAVEG